MFLAPLIATIIGTSLVTNTNPITEMRMVIVAATAGTLIGVFLIPTFLKIFEKAVGKLELRGSVPSLVIEALHVNNMKRIVKSATRPSKNMLSRLRFRRIPKRFLILNILVTGVYTVGVLAANYSALLVGEEDRLAAAASSGMIS